MMISGYASLYDKLDLKGDVVNAGAFDLSLKKRGLGFVSMLHEHRGKPVGSWHSLKSDKAGLKVGGVIHCAKVQSLVVGGLCGLSIGFRTQEWSPREGGRFLRRVELVEISIVRVPALSDAILVVDEHSADAGLAA